MKDSNKLRRHTGSQQSAVQTEQTNDNCYINYLFTQQNPKTKWIESQCHGRLRGMTQRGRHKRYILKQNGLGSGSRKGPGQQLEGCLTDSMLAYIFCILLTGLSEKEQ